MTLLILSSVSSIAIAIVSVLVFYILNTLRENKTQQEALLNSLEAANNLHQQNQQQFQINAEEIVKQVEALNILKNQIVNLTYSNANFETLLNKFQETNQNFHKNINNSLQDNSSNQLNKLQAVVEKIESFLPIQNQVTTVAQSVSSLESNLTENLPEKFTEKFTEKLTEKFTELQEANQNSQENITNLLQGNNSNQTEKFEVVLEKLEAALEILSPVLTQVTTVTDNISNLETSFEKLQESNLVQVNTNHQLENLQALVEKLEKQLEILPSTQSTPDTENQHEVTTVSSFTQSIADTESENEAIANEETPLEEEVETESLSEKATAKQQTASAKSQAGKKAKRKKA